MLIHISGPPGAGKTTLKNPIAALRNDIVAVDLDDIDDAHALELLSAKHMCASIANGNIDRFFRAKNKLNMKWLKTMKSIAKEKYVILFGLSFGYFLADKKYSLKVDPMVLYKRICARTL